MKQRFSAGGTKSVWIASSLDGLEKAEFENIRLQDDHIYAQRDNQDLTISFEDRSPGQITLEIIGEDEQHLNLYKYNVARILQNTLKDPQAEEKASARIAAQLDAQKPVEEDVFELPDFSELEAGVTAPLPISEILQTEQAQYSEEKIRARLDEVYELDNQEEAKKAEEQGKTDSPAEEKPEENKPEEENAFKESILETDVQEPEDDEVIIQDEVTQLSKPANALEALDAVDNDYKDLLPVENPTTAGELYHNMLAEGSEETEKIKTEAQAALPDHPFYTRDWFVMLMLVILPPVGIYLVWKNKMYTDNARKIITVFFAALTVVYIWMIVSLAGFGGSSAITTEVTVSYKADSVDVPSRQDQVNAYWNDTAVQNFMTTVGTLQTEYTTVAGSGITSDNTQQVLDILAQIQAADNNVLSVSDVGESNSAYTVQAKVNEAATALNNAIDAVNTAVANSDTDGLSTATEQLGSAFAIFNQITTIYDAAIAP